MLKAIPRLGFGCLGFWVFGCLLCNTRPVAASETNSVAAPKFLGAQSCSTSGCHGGAGELNKQFTLWTQYDFHHQRPVATLTTARSERLAKVLQIADPTKHARCTACHAPFQTVPAALLDKDVKVTEGVSCESCHGPAEKWLLSHTRKDYSHADRVHSGMRDLKNPYVRANTCVACHQNVDSELLRAGHPELIFELDGQAVTQPKHWRKSLDRPGPQLWLVGQAVALREMSWQLAGEKSPHENLADRWAGLLWVLQRVRESLPESSVWPYEDLAPALVKAESLQKLSDHWAQAVADLEWSDATTKTILTKLASTHDEFRAPHRIQLHARRAERLVLALDRLTQASRFPTNGKRVNSALNRLFEDVQSLPDFEPLRFAADLKEFHARVSGLLNDSGVHERPPSP